jgi:Zn-dependent protease
MDFSAEQIIHFSTAYVIVLLSLSAHEWGHAYSAVKLGDDTPLVQGRVTLNPLAHIDLIGTVLMPLLALVSGFAVIGWAKPVMVNPRNLSRRSDMAWITIAGPAVNLVLALIAAVALGIFSQHSERIAAFAALFMQINVGLMVFNLLPIPPLDGSKFLMYWFGMSEETYYSIARFGFIILLALVNIPQTRHLIVTLFTFAVMRFYDIASLIAGLF